MREKIRSRSNPEIRERAKLRQKKYRDREGVYLIEGTKLLDEALKSSVELQDVYAVDAWLEEQAELAEKIEQMLDITPVTPEVLKLLSTMVSPEGVVAVASLPDAGTGASLPESLIDTAKSGTSYVILEDVQDPGNLGTIIRTADAAGYDLVVLTEKCADAYGEKALRASMGSVFHLPVLRVGRLDAFLENLRKASFEIVGSSLQGEQLDFCQVHPSEKTALILGNESRGMSSMAAGYCTRLVKIPIYGQAESLNVAVAAGILLYAFTTK